MGKLRHGSKTNQMTKIYSLVFDYQLAKMQSSGRHWAPDAYKNKDYIFSYSAASIATFLDKNPHLPYTIYTDDVNLLAAKLDAYTPSTAKLDLVDLTSKIQEWTQHPYCFWPVVALADEHYTGQEDCLKLDNDLTCLKPIDELLTHRGAILWKFERQCSAGREYWGERKAARVALGTEDFPVYNMGLFGLSKDFQKDAANIKTSCEALIKVDISDVHRYPEAPGKKASMWSCSEQTAVCHFLHANGIPIREGHDFFFHHCYTPSKTTVLDAATYLLRQR